jgi:hypothetical protein
MDDVDEQRGQKYVCCVGWGMGWYNYVSSVAGYNTRSSPNFYQVSIFCVCWYTGGERAFTSAR